MDKISDNFINKYLDRDMRSYLYSGEFQSMLDIMSNTRKSLCRFDEGRYIVIDKANRKYTPLILTTSKNQTFYFTGNYLPENSVAFFTNYLLIKLKKPIISSEIFGYSKTKHKAWEDGEVLTIMNIIEGYKAKKDGKLYDVVEVRINGRNLKIVADEIEFINPLKLDLFKGYTPKKDRTVRNGSKIRIIKDKKIPFKIKNRKGVVVGQYYMMDTNYADVIIEDKIYKCINVKYLKVI